MSDVDPIIVEITNKSHLAAMWRYIGVSSVFEDLQKKPEFLKLPGYGLAVALVEKDLATVRSIYMTDNLRAVAKAGIDVAKVSRVDLETGPNGAMRLLVKMMDLADLAGAGE